MKQIVLNWRIKNKHPSSKKKNYWYKEQRSHIELVAIVTQLSLACHILLIWVAFLLQELDACHIFPFLKIDLFNFKNVFSSPRRGWSTCHWNTIFLYSNSDTSHCIWHLGFDCLLCREEKHVTVERVCH